MVTWQSAWADNPLRRRPTAVTPNPTPRIEPASRDTPAGLLDAKTVAQIATSLWRLRNRVLDPTNDIPISELRHLRHHIQDSIDVLEDAAITIQSHDNAGFDPGLALTVVAYQPTPGLDREKIMETIRPTIYFAGNIIQNGEVIVGAPDPGAADDT